ncbi:MAG: pyridoxal-phosphate dependent enzyme, partial [Gemmatimonadota bacterium]|nr:pyridoxal-phosphate dependent enzyme [Gemmatimonadota bacterium]
DPDIIAGAGSTGIEIMDESPKTTVIVVPVGGGGQIAGIAGAVKPLFGNIRIYGVEPTGAAAMHLSLKKGQPVRLDSVNTIADGLAPPMAGDLNFAFVKEYVEDVVLVDDADIVDGMKRVSECMKLIVEPSGAAAVAALTKGLIPVGPEDTVVAVLSGGNVDSKTIARLFA